MNESKIDSIFNEMVGGLDLGQDGIHETVSIDDVKNLLLTRLESHVSSMDPIDTSDEEAYAAACRYLSGLIVQDLEKIRELALDDKVVSTVGAIYAALNIATGEYGVHEVQPGSQLRGSVGGFLALDTSRLVLPERTATQLEGGSASTRSYGLAMVVLNGRLEDGTSSASLSSDKIYILVPLERATPFSMKKVVPSSV